MKLKTLLPVLALGAVAAIGQAQNLTTFDAITGPTGYGLAPATGRTVMGQAFNFGNATGPQTIAGLDILLGSGAVATYTSLQLQITFFDTFTAGAATEPAFSNPLATVNVNFGAFTAAANTVYTVGTSNAAANPAAPGITFTGAPITFTGTTNKGVQFLWLGDTGTGLVPTSNLTTAIRGGAGTPAYAVGSGASGAAPSFGYFRNASAPAQTTSAISLRIDDGRQVGDNSGLAFRLYSADPVPEPATMAALGLGALALLKRRRKSA